MPLQEYIEHDSPDKPALLSNGAQLISVENGVMHSKVPYFFAGETDEQDQSGMFEVKENVPRESGAQYIEVTLDGEVVMQNDQLTPAGVAFQDTAMTNHHYDLRSWLDESTTDAFCAIDQTFHTQYAPETAGNERNPNGDAIVQRNRDKLRTLLTAGTDEFWSKKIVPETEVGRRIIMTE